MNSCPYPVDSAGSDRQAQSFQLPSGPPWIHNSIGAGAWSSGSTNQDRTVVPSATVAVTSVNVPGRLGKSTHGSTVITPPGSIRTGCGGAAYELRNANSTPPGAATTSV